MIGDIVEIIDYNSYKANVLKTITDTVVDDQGSWIELKEYGWIHADEIISVKINRNLKERLKKYLEDKNGIRR